jgi:hypothetical protein
VAGNCVRIFAAASGDKIFRGIESLLQTPYNKIHICRIMELRHERHLLKIRDQKLPAVWAVFIFVRGLLPDV